MPEMISPPVKADKPAAIPPPAPAPAISRTAGKKV